MMAYSDEKGAFDGYVPAMTLYTYLSWMSSCAALLTATYICVFHGFGAGALVMGTFLITRKATNMVIAVFSGGLLSEDELAKAPATLVSWTRRTVIAEWILVVVLAWIVANYG